MNKNSKNRAAILSICAAALLGLGAGCQSSPSKSHVIRVVGTGTDFGINQNPVTGFYELGLKRVQTEVTTVPVIWTNGAFYIPDVVERYEVNTHSSIFGNAALTSTMATGSNAVLTSLGGASQPINANTGVSNNLPTALPK